MTVRSVVTTLFIGLTCGLALSLSTAGAAGCEPDCAPGETEHRSTLTVTPPPVAGTVTGGAIACPGTCVEEFVYTCFNGCSLVEHPTATLTASRTGYAAEWTGCTNVTAGNLCEVTMSTDRTVSLTWVDVQPPTVSLQSPLTGGEVRPGFLMSATATDNVGVHRVEFRINGAPAGPSDTSAPYAMNAPGGYSHGDVLTVSAQSFDVNGNNSPAVSANNVTVDAQVSLTLDPAPAPGTITNATTLPLAFTTDADVSAADRECQLDGGGYSDCSSPYAPDLAALADGDHTYHVRVVDNVANTATGSRTFTIDRTNPVTNITTGPVEGSTIAVSNASFAFTATDLHTPTSTCAVDLDAAAACASTFEVAGLANGVHSVTITTTDAAGNSHAVVRSFVVQVPAAATPPPPPAPPTPPATPPTPPAAPLPRLVAPVTARFDRNAVGTRVTRLELTELPAGAKVQVSCSGKGCPPGSTTVKVAAGKAVLTGVFSKRRLRPGAVVEIRVTAPGLRGQVVRFTIRKGAAPKRSTTCLVPGAAKPSAC